MEGVKTWLSSPVADFLGTGLQKRFPNMTSSIPVVTMFRSSLSMYVLFVYNTIFSHWFMSGCPINGSSRRAQLRKQATKQACFVNSSPEVTF
jgi:hypothetical protein